MPMTQIKSGISIRTYNPAPKHFDPLTASDSLLLRHGYPTRPDAEAFPELRKVWERAISGRLNYIVPMFRVNEDKTHGPIHPATSLELFEVAGAATSKTWSGSVVSVPDAGDSFKSIVGRWTVPNTYPSSSGNWEYSSQWIGIDGSGTKDVFQAGTETDAIMVGGIIQRQTYAWWQWFPNTLVAITNFPVSPGDVIWCALCVTSVAAGSVYLRNVSSGNSTSFTVNAPTGTLLVGNSAEWVVERVTINGSLPRLVNYGVVFFDEGIAYYATGAPGSTQNLMQIDLGAGTFVTMTGNNNASLSVPIDEGDTTMAVSWEAGV